MDTHCMNHEEITAIMSAQGGYGKGITPNPYAEQQKEWQRRKKMADVRDILTKKIESLFEIRFITPPETSECIESIVTMTDSRSILEVGMHIGFTSLHILRAIVGKSGAKLTSIDARPAHDREFFQSREIGPWFNFIDGWTPGAFAPLKGQTFDLVFVDSDHSIEHTSKEIEALWKLTKPGAIFLFHDVPEWQTPDNHAEQAVRKWLWDRVALGTFRGGILPTCEQLDCLDVWGAGYPKQCNPHLGIFVRGNELK